MRITLTPSRTNEIAKLHFSEMWLADQDDKVFGTFAVSMNKHMRNKLVYIFMNGEIEENKAFLKRYFHDCLDEIKVFDDGKSLIIPFDYINNVKAAD